jgi:hypothetical protein
VTVVTITRIPRDDRHNKRECDTNFFVCLLVRRYRTDALGAATDLLRTTLRFEDLFAMCNEHSGKYTPRPPVCPSCAHKLGWQFDIMSTPFFFVAPGAATGDASRNAAVARSPVQHIGAVR